MSRKAAGADDPPGAFIMCGEAVVIERETPAGVYLAWSVIRGDPRDMPDFWPA
jgi:hypothetical protein